MRRLISGWLSVVSILAAGTAAVAQPLPASTPLDIWGGAGVTATARDGHLLYLGGVNYVGPATGALAWFDGASGALLERAPALSGPVTTVHSLADGGSVVAGTLRVGAGGSQTLLRVDASGAVVPWYPEISGYVQAMASDGATLYIAGSFGTVDGQPRDGAAAFDLTTGQLRPWNPALGASVGSVVTSQIVAAQGVVFLAGAFNTAHGQPAVGFVAVDGASAARLAHAVPPMSVRAMAVAADALYVLGEDTQSGGPVSARLSVSSAQAQTWTVSPSVTNVMALRASATAVYARDPGGITVLDPGTAAVIAQAPFQSLSAALALDGTALYLVDDLGETRCEVVSYDTVTLTRRAWSAVCQGVATIDARADRVAVAGVASVGGVARRGLAAIDLRTGRPTPFAPDVQGGRVMALTVIASIVVAGGDFTSVGGQPQHGLVALLPDGQMLAWRPLTPSASDPGPFVLALATDGRRLFAGGSFVAVAGQGSRNLVAFDLATAQPAAWAPNPDGVVAALEATADTLYAGGAFTSIDGVARGRGAAFTAADLALTSWNPGADFPIVHVAASGSRVAVAGQFTTLQGAPAFGFGIFDAAGRLAPFAQAPTFARGVAARGDVLFVAADARVIAMSISTGAPYPFAADSTSGGVTGTLNGLRIDGDGLVVRGAFDLVAGQPAAGVAVFPLPAVGSPTALRATVRGAVVSLAWALPVGAAPDAYLVEAGTARGTANVGVVPLAATSIGGSLAPGTYFLRVRGVRGGRAGDASSEVVLTVPSMGSAPSAPGPLSGTVVLNAVQLSWGEAAGNAESYVLEAGTGPGRTDIGAFDTGVLDTRFFAVVPRGLYYIRVRAKNAFGLSAPTNEIVLSVP